MTDQLPARAPADDAPGLAAMTAGRYRISAVTAVCDPQLPPAFRRWVLRRRPCFDTRGKLVALAPGGSSRGARPAAVGGWLLAVACLVMLFVDQLSAGWVAWLAAASGAAISAATIQLRANRHDLELASSKVIFPESLNVPSQVLLGRAQYAIRTVLSSPVRAAGLLGHHVDDSLLSEHEWEIAPQAPRDNRSPGPTHGEHRRWPGRATPARSPPPTTRNATGSRP